MKTLRSLVAAALVLAACTAPACDYPYDDNDLELITRYRARMLCVCLFVQEREKDYCDRWTRQSPNLATYSIDWDDRSVRTQAMMYWGAKARFTGPEFGCVLE